MNTNTLLEEHGLSNLVEAATALATFSHICGSSSAMKARSTITTIPNTVVTHDNMQQQLPNNLVFTNNTLTFQSPCSHSTRNLFINTPANNSSTSNVNTPSTTLTVPTTPAHVQTESGNSNLTNTNIVKESFPEKLHTILNDAEIKGFADVISWLPNGQSFIIARPDLFMESILPQYIKPETNATTSTPSPIPAPSLLLLSSSSPPIISTKYPSFTRKLNRWGFRQVTRGPETGAFHHPLFRRHQPDLCVDMFCQRNSKKTQPNTKPKVAKIKATVDRTKSSKKKKRSVSSLTKESLEMMNQEQLQQQHENASFVIQTSNLQTVDTLSSNNKHIAAVSEDSQSLRSSTSGGGNSGNTGTKTSSETSVSSKITNNPHLVQRAITKRNEEERMRLAKIMLYNSFLQAMNGEE